MGNKEQEACTAMKLAQRTYLCSLFHGLFGGAADKKMAALLIADETKGALSWLEESLAHDKEIAAKCIGLSERTLSECVDEALACVDKLASDGDVEGIATVLREDYPKLFQVPGDAFVRPWESPYVSTDGMLFRESTLDVRSFYHDAGFRLKAEQHFPDDHIAAMMDYLAKMGQRTYEAYADGDDAATAELLRTQADFVRKHVLTWVDAFADKVVQNDTRAYYAAFAGALAAFAWADGAFADELARELAAA